jgi:23S rRNA (cytosine1962-C5)-methyltransferase
MQQHPQQRKADLPAKIMLKPGKEKSVMRLHPWIFSGAIRNADDVPTEGDLVEVYSHAGEFLATGYYQIGSIAIRIISFSQITPDFSFWHKMILGAYNLRKSIGLIGQGTTNVYRLVNAEGDGLPGLVIDYYNGIAVLQMHSIGMYRVRNLLVQVLQKIYDAELIAVYDKSEGSLPFKAGLNAKNEFLYGNLDAVEIKEYGCRFQVNITSGQKTGFFIDQRENRKLLGEYAAGRSVLNMFCYTGGFSVYALHGGATLVHSVDSSAQATELAEKNMLLNTGNSERHKVYTADAFDFLNTIGDKYDVIVLDPPAFAKHQDALGNALQAYKRLNMKAIEHIRKGGILFTFSCSQVVSRESFRKAVFAASANTGRYVRILHQLAQPADHPVSIYHPEGEYLKGLVLHID